MNFLVKFIGYWIRLPAELKGMKFGKNSFIGPGYDFWFVPLKGITTGENVQIGRNAWLQTLPGATIKIGSNSAIGRNAVISSLKNIEIGRECVVSYNVSMFDHDHEYTNPEVSPKDSGLTNPSEIIIEDECFIGAHSFILRGVHLGKHCVVGANSVVTKSFPAYSLIAGNPARLIRPILNMES